MAAHRASALVVATVVIITACSGDQGAQVVVPGDEPTPSEAPDPTDPPPTDPPSSDPVTTTSESSTSAAPTTTVAPTTTPAPTPTTAPAGPAPTTTTIAPVAGVYDPNCVVEIAAGDTLNLIAERFDDETVTAANLVIENGIADPDVINEGDLLDVCVGNGLDDLTGEERLADGEGADEGLEAVKVQQRKLNELFEGFGIRELLVDGISGPVTRQRLCAARLALGLPVTRADMEPGSEEERVLIESDALKIPFVSAITSDRWVLIDRTCQIMFAGEGNRQIRFVFPTSTGEPGYETRPQDRSRAFRYDPATDNGGWHNSTTFPVAIDNPLNGNMYKPIYFDGGQAIHGSNNVPRTPQSKGCARLRVEDQDALVGWLGLAGVTTPSWSERQIDLTVNVQGEWVPD